VLIRDNNAAFPGKKTMRRSDYDVSDTVRTTDTGAVGDEVLRLYTELYDGRPGRALRNAFGDVSRYYNGLDADFCACDTSYHDIQHVLDVTLTMARLLDGYERSRRNGTPPLPPDVFAMGVVAALYHDFGYLRRRKDRTHHNGAEYTQTHVARGAKFLMHHLPDIGLARHARAASQIVHFTGYERAVEAIRVSDPLLRRVGHMLGTADILAQMSDRCYLEKCRDRLYPEFVAGGIARRLLPNGRTETLFASGDDLVWKTPSFYKGALYRIEVKLGRAYKYADYHFRGQNPYLDEIQRTVQYAERMAKASPREVLRRSPPWTLVSRGPAPTAPGSQTVQ